MKLWCDCVCVRMHLLGLISIVLRNRWGVLLLLHKISYECDESSIAHQLISMAFLIRLFRLIALYLINGKWALRQPFDWKNNQANHGTRKIRIRLIISSYLQHAKYFDFNSIHRSVIFRNNFGFQICVCDPHYVFFHTTHNCDSQFHE